MRLFELIASRCRAVGSVITSQTLSISTSAPQCMARRTGFQSNVKKSIPRALLFNKDNFIEWKRTGFDVFAAESIMEKALTMKLLKKKDLELEELQKQLMDLIRQTKTMAELRMITRPLASSMSLSTIITAMSKVHQVETSPIHNTEAKAMLESLLSFLEPSIPSLRTGQLAIVLSSLSRAVNTPNAPESSINALRLQLEGEQGTSRLIDVDPGLLASLVSSAQKLRYGDKAWWISAATNVSSNLALMQPGDVKRTMQAASAYLVTAAGAASSQPHRFSPDDPFSSSFWSKAEPIVTQRIRSNELDDLQATSLLRSFSLASSALQRGKVGNEVWTALSERFQERSGESPSAPNPVPMPPQALVNLAWSCAAMKEGFGWQGNSSDKGQEDPALSSVLATTLASATSSITHFDVRQIESLLSATALALDGRKGSPQPSVLPPLIALTAMVSDVMEIRGFDWVGSGAIPSSPDSYQQGPKASSACHILLLLANLGHFEALGLKLGNARKAANRDPLALPPQTATRSSLLKTLYSQAKSLLLPLSSLSFSFKAGHANLPIAPSTIGIEATCNLLGAYERAGSMAPSGSAFILATLAAQRELSPALVTARTRQYHPKQVLKALVTLLRAASNQPSFASPSTLGDASSEDKRAADFHVGVKALKAAIENLADLIAAPPSFGGATLSRELKELKETLASSTFLPKDHPIYKI